MTTHHLTEQAQGRYHYTVGPYAQPVLRVRPGDVIVVETHDAFEGRIKDETTKPSDVVKYPFVNPQNGPIYVEGASHGDALIVRIESIVPRGPQPRGTTCLVPYFGGLTSTDLTAMLHDPLPEIVKKLHITDVSVRWNERIEFPYRPFIGTISTSPEIDSVGTLTPGNHGGNMDLPDVCPGATIYLPVRAEGALLYLGDCHATQGDGEVCGVAAEHPTVTTISVDVRKRWALSWPRLENEQFIMSIGSARPMEDAARIAYVDLIKWLVADFGFDKWDAYLMLTQIGHVRLGNMCDPNYTIGAGVA